MPDPLAIVPDEAPEQTPEGWVCGFSGCDYVGVSPQAVGMHRFHRHGVRGEDNKRKHARAKEAVATIKGEDIVLVVLSQLYPNGIPVSKIRAVLAWAHHTDEFVEQIRG